MEVMINVENDDDETEWQEKSIIRVNSQEIMVKVT